MQNSKPIKFKAANLFVNRGSTKFR